MEYFKNLRLAKGTINHNSKTRVLGVIDIQTTEGLRFSNVPITTPFLGKNWGFFAIPEDNSLIDVGYTPLGNPVILAYNFYNYPEQIYASPDKTLNFPKIDFGELYLIGKQQQELYFNKYGILTLKAKFQEKDLSKEVEVLKNIVEQSKYEDGKISKSLKEPNLVKMLENQPIYTSIEERFGYIPDEILNSKDFNSEYAPEPLSLFQDDDYVIYNKKIYDYENVQSVLYSEFISRNGNYLLESEKFNKKVNIKVDKITDNKLSINVENTNSNKNVKIDIDFDGNISLQYSSNLNINNDKINLSMNETGDITLSNDNVSLGLGNSGDVNLDSGSSHIIIDSSGNISLNNDNGTALEIKAGLIYLYGNGVQTGGQDLITWLNQHAHIGNLGAPTSPPLTPILIQPKV